MSALDDAIAVHLAHGAGACTDPLTESLIEQATTQQLGANSGPPLRAGWEHEPIVVPHRWGLYAIAFLIGLLGFATLPGCGGGDPDEPPPATTQPVDCHTHPELCK